MRPEILTSGRGVRRWEWVTLGDEFGGGKLVSTAQTQAPGPGHRERENIPVLPNLDIFQISPNILDFHSDAH